MTCTCLLPREGVIYAWGWGDRREMKGHEPRIISWPGAQEGSLRTPKGQPGSWDPVSPEEKSDSPFSSTWTKSWHSLEAPCPLRLSCWAGAGWCQQLVLSVQSGVAQGPEM